jgi:hypothetical protein
VISRNVVCASPLVRQSGKRLLIALAATVLCACSTAAKIRELDHQRLMLTRDALVQQRNALVQEPEPTDGRQAEIFVGETAVNELLSQATKFEFAISDLKGVAFDVPRAEIDFRNAIAEVKLDLRAKHEKFGFEVALASIAELALLPSSPSQKSIELQLRIVEAVPRAKWWFFRIRFGLFVRRLLRIAASEYASHMPSITLPVEEQIPYAFRPGEIDIDIGDATAIGPLTTPPLSGVLAVSIDRYLILPDGLHIYLKLNDN